MSKQRLTDQTSAPSWPLEMVGLVGFLSLYLFYFQYSTVEKFSTLPPSRPWGSLSNFLDAVETYVELDLADGLRTLILLGTVAAIVLLEIWGRRLTLFFERIFVDEQRTICFLVLTSFVLVRFYISGGESNWTADWNSHNTYAWIITESFKNAEIPIWTNYLSGGGPFLQFYGFLYFYIVGVVAVIVGDVFPAIKLTLMAGHVMSGVSMYLFVRVLTRSRPAAFLAAVCYVASFWHTMQIIYPGRSPVSLVYALLPLPFYFFEKLRLRQSKLPATFGGAVSFALLTYTHPGYALWTFLFFLLYAGSRYALTPFPGKTIQLAAAQLAVGVILSLYLTLPMLLEKTYTALYSGLDASSIPDPSLRQLLTWSNFRFAIWPLPGDQQHWYGGYIGISILAAAGLGAFASFWNRRPKSLRTGRPAAGCLLVCLVLIFGYRLPGLQDIPVVKAVNAARYLVFLVFFASCSAGICIMYWDQSRGIRTGDLRPFSALLILVILDLGPTTFQRPYSSENFLATSADITEDQKKYIDWIETAQDELPNYRTFCTMTDVYPAVAASQTVVKGRGTSFNSLYDERPLAVLAHAQPYRAIVTPWFDQVEDVTRLTESIRRAGDQYVYGVGLLLQNIRYVWLYRKRQDKVDGTVTRFRHHSPIVVSPKAVEWHYQVKQFRSWDPDEVQTEYMRLIVAMQVDVESQTCEMIPMFDLPGDHDLGTSPQVTVLAHRVFQQRVVLNVRISDPCYARLAYPHYPYLNVRVNGVRVESLQTADRFIALRLDRGDHIIVLEPSMSPLRLGLLTLDILAFAGMALVLVVRRVRP